MREKIQKKRKPEKLEKDWLGAKTKSPKGGRLRCYKFLFKVAYHL